MADSSDKVDRISALPDDLLCQILSFLPIKEAAATSVLSPRWRYLITSLLDINLEFNDPSDELDPIQHEQSHRQFSEFINFGSNLILRRNRAPIRKFELTIFPPWLSETFQVQIDSLISAVLLCNVQELEIFLFENDTNRSNLLGIFTCKTLVDLKMDRRVYLDIHIPHSIDLPNLEVLHLESYSTVGEVSLHILIKGCPLLKELYLYMVECPTNLSDQLSMSGIFRCKTLVSLKLSWQDGLHLSNLVLPNSVCLPNLKVLNLKDFTLVCKDSLRRLIHGCPLLEELYLFGLDFSSYASDFLDISSPSLKKLLLYCSLRDVYTIILDLTALQWLVYQANGEHVIFINAPNLQVLDYVGDADAVNFMECPKFAIRARVVVQSSFENRTERSSLHIQAAFQLINYLQNVKSFSLSDCTLEALYHSPHPLPIFKNLINLHLDFNEHCHDSGAYHVYWWELLPRLLESTPNLEVLVLDKTFWNNLGRDKELQSLLPVAFPLSIIERLREMEIKGFIMLENNRTFIEYFLQNGKALKKMTLGALLLPSDCNRISFKKCSEDCQIVFRQMHYWNEPEFD